MSLADELAEAADTDIDTLSPITIAGDANQPVNGDGNDGEEKNIRKVQVEVECTTQLTFDEVIHYASTPLVDYLITHAEPTLSEYIQENAVSKKENVSATEGIPSYNTDPSSVVVHDDDVMTRNDFAFYFYSFFSCLFPQFFSILPLSITPYHFVSALKQTSLDELKALCSDESFATLPKSQRKINSDPLTFEAKRSLKHFRRSLIVGLGCQLLIIGWGLLFISQLILVPFFIQKWQAYINALAIIAICYCCYLNLASIYTLIEELDGWAKAIKMIAELGFIVTNFEKCLRQMIILVAEIELVSRGYFLPSSKEMAVERNIGLIRHSKSIVQGLRLVLVTTIVNYTTSSTALLTGLTNLENLEVNLLKHMGEIETMQDLKSAQRLIWHERKIFFSTILRSLTSGGLQGTLIAKSTEVQTHLAKLILSLNLNLDRMQSIRSLDTTSRPSSKQLVRTKKPNNASVSAKLDQLYARLESAVTRLQLSKPRAFDVETDCHSIDKGTSDATRLDQRGNAVSTNCETQSNLSLLKEDIEYILNILKDSSRVGHEIQSILSRLLNDEHQDHENSNHVQLLGTCISDEIEVDPTDGINPSENEILEAITKLRLRKGAVPNAEASAVVFETAEHTPTDLPVKLPIRNKVLGATSSSKLDSQPMITLTEALAVISELRSVLDNRQQNAPVNYTHVYI